MSTAHRDQYIENFVNNLQKKLDLQAKLNLEEKLAKINSNHPQQENVIEKAAPPPCHAEPMKKFLLMRYFPSDLKDWMTTTYFVRGLPVHDLRSFSVTNRYFFWLVKDSRRSVKRTPEELQLIAKKYVFNYSPLQV
jgi:hypothetical protein